MKIKKWVDMNKTEKIVYSVIVFSIFSMVVSVVSPKKSEEDKVEVEADVSGTQPKSDNTPTPTLQPTKELTKEEIIDNKVREILGEKYVKTEIIKDNDGTYFIGVDYILSDNLSNNLIKTGYYRTAAPIYEALYTGEYNINSVAINGVGPIRDKYGNESTGVVYNTHLKVADGSKVNWKLDDVQIQLIITDLATVGVNLLK